ncbi:MAG: HAD-IA family hydrolase [Acidimicrobiales bacterium]|jgi:putative hydrolase of the HAD superfamily
MPTADIEAVLFDFGGVIADSPFEAFKRYERAKGLPEGFIRTLNATNHHDNAWARLERNELGFDEFCDAFEEEASDAGGTIDTRELFAMLSGSLRPEMVEAVRRCADRFKTALLTNNFVTPDSSGTRPSADHAEVLELFDVVIESSVVGIRKPDPRFYMLACEALGIEPEHAVFLDDLGVNLKPARELGMVTIKVVSTGHALAELEAVLGMTLR